MVMNATIKNELQLAYSNYYLQVGLMFDECNKSAFEVHKSNVERIRVRINQLNK